MENKEIILVGDFNCDWDPEKNRISWQTDYLKDIANTYQFKQLITGHTRITESLATLIDLAFSQSHLYTKENFNTTQTTKYNCCKAI